MSYLFQSSPTYIPLWLAVLGAVATPTLALLGVWLNRKRSTTVQAEEDKLEAETTNLATQSISSLLADLRTTRSELTAIILEASEKAKEGRKRETFLRDQVEWHEELSIRARKAAHAAINEIQRCVIAIHLRDDALREARLIIQQIEDLLTSNQIVFTRRTRAEVPAFEQKQHDDIVDYQALPLPPETPK